MPDPAAAFRRIDRDGGGKVNAALLGKIIASWVLTLPLAGGVAAALTVLFRAAISV